MDRTKEIGKMSQDGGRLGHTGPNLRATGLKGMSARMTLGLFSKITSISGRKARGTAGSDTGFASRRSGKASRSSSRRLTRSSRAKTMGKIAKTYRVPAGEGYGHLEAPRASRILHCQRTAPQILTDAYSCSILINLQVLQTAA